MKNHNLLKRLRPLLFILSFTFILATFLIRLTAISTASTAAIGPTRRVNIPYQQTNAWEQSGVFWFGVNEPTNVNGRNYTDVRLFYTDEKLEIRFSVVDYRLWYKKK